MFNFLFALLGGAYLVGKYTHEKVKEKQYEINTKKRDAVRSQLQSRFEATFQQEEKVKEYVYCGHNYDKICEEFQEDFCYIFGSNWREILQIPPIPITRSQYMCNDSVYHVTWVKSLIIASNGKIESKFIRGYDIMNNEQTKELSYKFLQCIQKRLQTHGFNECFVFTALPNDMPKITLEPLATLPIIKKIS